MFRFFLSGGIAKQHCRPRATAVALTSCKLLAKLSRLRNRVPTLHSTVQVRTGLTSRGMSAGPSPVVARLQGRIWVQQLQKQYRPVPRNMARMADESRRERQEPQVRTHKTRHFGSSHCPLSAGLDADIGLAQCSLTPTRQKQSKILAVRGSVGLGGVEICLIPSSSLRPSRLSTVPSSPGTHESGHARGYPACQKPPRWHNLDGHDGHDFVL